MLSVSAPLRRGLIAALAPLALAIPVAAQNGIDLSGYATVDSALKTQIRQGPQRSVAAAAYLGVYLSEEKKGRFLVASVDAASPAARAGLQAGDELKKVEGKALKSREQLREAIRVRLPGDPLAIEVQREKKKLALTVPLGAVSRPLRLGEERAYIGLQLGDSATGDGVPIRRVTPGSPAEKAGLKDGDLIVRFNGNAFTDPGNLEVLLAEHSPGVTIPVTVRREGKDTEVRVELSKVPDDPGPGGRGRFGGGPQGGEPRLTRWTKPVYRLAVVCMEFADTKHNPQITLQNWDEQLFSTGTYINKNNATGQPVYGSMNDSFLEQSCGKLRIEGKVFDWVALPKNRADYSQGTASRGRSTLLTEALDLLVSREGSTALDGYDGVFFLYAGAQFPTTRGGIFWPHRSNVSHGGKRWPYFIVSEGGPRMTNISVFCHEFGHMLGLPDLYARPENPGSEGLGNWCLMSNQTGNGRPQHMSAWCKEQLNWVQPAVIDPTVPQKLVLSPITGSTKECFKVLIRPDGSEYLLLENRRKEKWDSALPAEGLLIWRVVGNRPILDESHGVEGPSGPRVFMSAVPYPSNANNAYTPYTTPSSRSMLGGGYPVWITNITKHPDGRVSFWIGYEFE